MTIEKYELKIKEKIFFQIAVGFLTITSLSLVKKKI